tara:strand:+ start:780 stop:1331 length:552 start_codon:yes stop_codon:yes gene_type:complete
MSQLKVDSIIPVGGIPSGGTGGVIQAKQTVKTDTFSQNLARGASSNVVMSVDFTPLKSTSILKISAFLCVGTEAVSGLPRAGFILTADGTTISGATGDQGQSSQVRVMSQASLNNSNEIFGICNLGGTYFHTVSNTNQVTYGVKVVSIEGDTVDFFVNRCASDQDAAFLARSMSTLTVEELSV